MNRRDALKRGLKVAAVAALVPQIGIAQAAPGCADCERLFSATFTAPEMFDRQQASGYVEMAQRSVHELAAREGVSHDEAGLRVWWDAFPTYTVEERVEVIPGYTQAELDAYARVNQDLKRIEAEAAVASPWGTLTVDVDDNGKRTFRVWES